MGGGGLQMSVYIVINFYYAVKTANSTAKHAISNTEMLSETLKQSILELAVMISQTKTSMVLTRFI